MQKESKDYFGLELLDGFIYVHINLGRNPVSWRLNSNSIQKIQLILRSSSVQAVLGVHCQMVCFTLPSYVSLQSWHFQRQFHHCIAIFPVEFFYHCNILSVVYIIEILRGVFITATFSVEFFIIAISSGGVLSVQYSKKSFYHCNILRGVFIISIFSEEFLSLQYSQGIFF